MNEALGLSPRTDRRVPHISLVFREMWDTAGLPLKPTRVMQLLTGALRQLLFPDPTRCSMGPQRVARALCGGLVLEMFGSRGEWNHADNQQRTREDT
jgi:hypothetical protein